VHGILLFGFQTGRIENLRAQLIKCGTGNYESGSADYQTMNTPSTQKRESSFGMRPHPWLFAALLLFLISLMAPDAVSQRIGGALVAERFKELSDATSWKEVEAHRLDFPTYHTQGMAIVGSRFFLSSVQVIDRPAEKGVGHLFEFDKQGRLKRSITLGEGAVYHPGGIDYDGEFIWVPVAEYRPASRSIVYTVNPKTMEYVRQFDFADHLGAIVHNTNRRTLVAANWDSRKFYTWALEKSDTGWTVKEPGAPKVTINGSHYINYQDCHYLPGTDLMLCGGLNRFRPPGGPPRGVALGGIDLIDLNRMQAIHQVPIPLWVAGKSGLAMTNNPFFYEIKDGRLRLHFIPQDDPSTLYTYETGK